MPSEQDQAVCAEEDIDEGESEEEDDDVDLPTHDPDDDEEEEDLNSPSSPSISSSSEENVNKDSSTVAGVDPNTTTITSAPNGSTVEILPAVAHSSPHRNPQRTEEVPAAAEEKKPSSFDDSRRLFQRLWTDEDEIGLLQGFLEYITQRGTQNSLHQHDTGPFYDQIKSRLQIDFNKNQLVEKLRRLKKKYRNVVSRISSGKDFSFKSPHDQATFEISRKIWSGIVGRQGGVEETGLEVHDGNPHKDNDDNNGSNSNIIGVDVNNSEKKVSSSQKRSRKRPAEGSFSIHQDTSSFPNAVEDTVKSCLSPLFKELIHCAITGPCIMGPSRGVAMNSLPLNFGSSSMNFSSGEVVDEKWRKQQILELEVYSKRIELVQDQIKSALEELRSMSSG